jgi:hypothetical protein
LIEESVLLEENDCAAGLSYLIGSGKANSTSADDDDIVDRLARHTERGDSKKVRDSDKARAAYE